MDAACIATGGVVFMTQLANESRSHLGFLRVAQTEHGYVGGLLVTNHQGRPLEFQCTSPVRPNRTQEILYGPTLEPFIYAELIGKTLFERLGVKPQLIVVQQEHLLELRRQVECPVACLVDAAAAPCLPDQMRISLGRQLVRLHADFPDDQDRLTSLQAKIPADADLIEPLDRVHDALKETLRAGAVA
jgi:hypothetical protein